MRLSEIVHALKKFVQESLSKWRNHQLGGFCLCSKLSARWLLLIFLGTIIICLVFDFFSIVQICFCLMEIFANEQYYVNRLLKGFFSNHGMNYFAVIWLWISLYPANNNKNDWNFINNAWLCMHQVSSKYWNPPKPITY